MDTKINTLQMMQFELMESVTLDGFDAKRIIADLTKHRDLWDAAIMMPDPNWGLLPLRDLGANRWNVDCLYIYASSDDREGLNRLVETWYSTESRWLDTEEQRQLMRVPDPLPHRVLRLFW